jgi:hypothetical protein
MYCINCKSTCENNQSWQTLCKPCYIIMKRKQTYKICVDCKEYKVRKNTKYSSCYECTAILKVKNKSVWELSGYAFSKIN